jgi:ferredoxin
MNFKIKEINCIGCGLCQTLCPKCFYLKNGLAKVKDNLNSETSCDFQEVLESCPCDAIKIKPKDNER